MSIGSCFYEFEEIYKVCSNNVYKPVLLYWRMADYEANLRARLEKGLSDFKSLREMTDLVREGNFDSEDVPLLLSRYTSLIRFKTLVDLYAEQFGGCEELLRTLRWAEDKYTQTLIEMLQIPLK